MFIGLNAIKSILTPVQDTVNSKGIFMGISLIVILLDDYDGLSNWDCYETDSLEKAIEIIDGGYGILSLVA